MAVLQTTDKTQLDQTILSQADEGSTDDHFSLKLRDDGTNVGMSIELNVGGSLTTAYSNDTPADDTTYIYEISSNGTRYTEKINGVVKSISGTDNGNWFGDSANLDNTVIGALVNSGGDSEYAYVKLGQMAGWDAEQEDHMMTDVRQMLAAQYGVTL